MSAKAAEAVQGTGQDVNTNLHDSCAACAWCAKPFVARIRTGRTASRFCERSCRYAWHNAERQRARENRASDTRYIHISYRGELLLFTPFEIAAGRRRGQEFTARTKAREGGELLVEQVLYLVGVRRSRLYQLMDHNGFPRPIIRPGHRNRAAWSEAAVLEWLARRGKNGRFGRGRITATFTGGSA